MPWIRNLASQLLNRCLGQEKPTLGPPAEDSRDSEEGFADLVTASTILDFGGLPIEKRSDEAARVRDFHLGLRPW